MQHIQYRYTLYTSGQAKFVLTMKKAILLLLPVFIIHSIHAQDGAKPKLALKWAPTGLILGSLSLHGEYNFGGKTALTAKIGIPVTARHDFKYEHDDATFDMKATSFLTGYRIYLSKQPLKGLYFEPFFKYVYHTSEGIANSRLNNRPVTMNITNTYSATGVGAQLGAQFFVSERFVIDFFFLGPEINAAKNKFKSVEATSVLEWDSVEAAEAERDIRDFIDDFPFIRSKTDVMVDKTNRTVTAHFKGALPGYRIGVSFGVAL